MPPITSPGRAAVHINGPALRVIRELLGVEIADLVVALECTPGYLSKLETGKSLRCSPAFLSRLVEALGGVDPARLRRALLACPLGADQHDAHVDDGGDTAPMPRPVADPAGPPIAVGAPRPRGRHRRGEVPA